MSQLNLIKAAEDASSTRRFIPSEYSFIQTEEYVSISHILSILRAAIREHDAK